LTNAKVYGMTEQLAIGAMGVNVAKCVLRSKYPDIVDYDTDKDMQKRGVDLLVKGLGLVEVKTDSHQPEAFFLELDVGGKPGGIDRCSADYICVLFYKHRLMYLLPRPNVQQWLREHYAWVLTEHPDWVKTTQSSHNNSTWSARGIRVPVGLLQECMDVAVITWPESGEVMAGVEWGGKK
jgi:hypothetical protein